MDFKETRNSLVTLFKEDIAELFQGIGTAGNDVEAICHRIGFVTRQYVEAPELFDMKDPATSNFMRIVLPGLVEAFLKRRSQCEHEFIITDMLVSVMALLTMVEAHYVPELCELRNMLLTGTISAHFKFFTPRQVKIVNNYNQYISSYKPTNCYFSDFGRPCLSAPPNSHKVSYFWSDEWQFEFGGTKAIGHFVKVFFDGQWVQGQVMGYHFDSRLHQVRFDGNLVNDPEEEPLPQCREESLQVYSRKNLLVRPNYNDQLNVTTAYLFLADCLHCWNDASCRGRWTASVSVSSNATGNNNNPPSPTTGTKQLLFSNADIGLYARVWWSRYKRYYYGRIVRFDGDIHQHTLIYEDGDVRTYDLTLKDFQVVYPPTTVVRSIPPMDEQVVEEQIARAAKIVGNWHREKLAVAAATTGSGNNNTSGVTGVLDGRPNPGTVGSGAVGAEAVSGVASSSELTPEEKREEYAELMAHFRGRQQKQRQQQQEQQDIQEIDLSSPTSVEEFKTRQQEILATKVAPRPAAAQCINMSTHQFEFINLYFESGGQENLFTSLSDESRAPPTCRIIQLHSLLLYHLRYLIRPNILRATVWELNEAGLNAILRSEESQIKEMSHEVLNEVIFIMKELVMLAVSSNDSQQRISANQQARIFESFDLFRLALASKLLKCSQLQKRYLGLSIIKEAIDCCFPRVAVFVAKRHTLLAPSLKSSLNKVLADIERHQAQLGKSQTRFSISSRTLEDWLIDNEVIEGIFGDSIHQDLAAKTEAVFVFLSHRRRLREKHLEALWQAGRGAHEAVVRVVHMLILMVLPVLDPALRMHMFHLISSVPAREYTEPILLLIKNYTVHAIAASKEDEKAAAKSSEGYGGENTSGVVASTSVPTGSQGTLTANGVNMNSGSAAAAAASSSSSQPVSRNSASGNNETSTAALSAPRKGLVMNAPDPYYMGFSVLWKFIQESNSADSSELIEENLINCAVQLFVELLQEEFRDERERILLKCLENLQMGLSVPASLQVMRCTLATYPTANKSWFPVVGRVSMPKQMPLSTMIDKLQKQHSLLEVFFAELARFHRQLYEYQSSAMSKTPLTSPPIPPASPAQLLRRNDVAANASMQQPTSFFAKSAPAVPSLTIPEEINSKGLRSNNSFTDPLNARNGRAALGSVKLDRNWHIKGITERLEFLKFVLSKSALCLDTAQTTLVWRALGEKALTGDALDKVMEWFEEMLCRENKPFNSLLNGFGFESDAYDPSLPSRLKFLARISVSSDEFQSSTGNAASAAVGAADDSTTGETTSAFEEGVLLSLFESSLISWATRSGNTALLSRPSVSSFFFKLFLLVNVNNKAIRIESDGSWVRVGQLLGLSVIWRMAIDANDSAISMAATTLLIELHHRLPPKFRGGESIRGYLLRQCFRQLGISVQSLRITDTTSAPSLAISRDDPSAANVSQAGSSVGGGQRTPTGTRQNSSAAEQPGQDGRLLLEAESYPIYVQCNNNSVNRGSGSTSDQIAQLPQSLEDWFEDPTSGLPDTTTIARRISRFVQLLRLFIRRFSQSPIQLMLVQVQAGRDNTILASLTMKATDTLGQLRKRIGEYFNEPVESIVLSRASKSQILGAGLLGNQERLDKYEWSLKQAKFQMQETITAQLIVGSTKSSPKSGESTSQEEEDLIRKEGLCGDINSVMTPQKWCAAYAPRPSDDTIHNAEKFSVSLPTLTLPVHVDMTLNGESSKNMAAAVAATTVTESTPAGTIRRHEQFREWQGQLQEFLGPLLRNSPAFVDQLLEILDGYLSTELTQVTQSSDFDLSAAVWDVLQALPTHPLLLQQVRELKGPNNGTVRQLLDLSSPYRLLYSLQIMDAFLDGENDFYAGVNVALIARKITEWSLKFLHEGGFDLLVNLLHSVTEMLQPHDVGNTAPLFVVPTGGISPSHGGTKAVAENFDGNFSGTNSTGGIKERPWGTVSRDDVFVMIMALLNRLLHRFLLFDPAYSCWNNSFLNPMSFSKYFAGDAMIGGNEKVPEGLVLTCIHPASFIAQSLSSAYRLTQAFAGNRIASSSLKCLGENVLMLVLGLVTVQENGLELLKSWGQLTRWIRALCLRMPHLLVRESIARVFFDGCANIWYHCYSNSHGLIIEQKTLRLKLFDHLFQSAFDATTSISPMTRATALTNSVTARVGSVLAEASSAEQIYSLLASLTALIAAPSLIFPDGTLKFPTAKSLTRYLIPEVDHDLSSNDMVRVGVTFVQRLLHHQSSESFHSPQPDGTLLGILRILLVLTNGGKVLCDELGSVCPAALGCHQEPNGPQCFIGFLYVKCLFPGEIVAKHDDGNNKQSDSGASIRSLGAICQTPESRNHVYALLFKLCYSSEANLSRLASIMTGDLNTTMPVTASKSQARSVATRAFVKNSFNKPWNYDPGALVKDPGAYVGLCNQGATCYMNSFLQQLYHITSFSDGLLKIETEATAEESDQQLVLFQLQVLFGFLRVSQKRYYDTLPFCKVFKDYDGEPVQLNEQKDANEFAGMLFDKLESNPHCKELLAKTLQGSIVWKTRSIETPYKSDREEKFYMITAEVKNKSSLEESLDLLVSEELFAGENKLEDPVAGKKVDALRRCAFRHLPSTLLIHLKRFEFNLETMDRNKVNDFLSFPMELDMQPYTEGGIVSREAKLRPEAEQDSPILEKRESESGDCADVGDDQTNSSSVPCSPKTSLLGGDSPRNDDCLYALKGIVAHVGSIDRGHYYSFIRDSQNPSKWLEFNDRSVIPFSASSIPSECFGGEESFNVNGVTQSRPKQKNAYILVYEKIDENKGNNSEITSSVPPSPRATDQLSAALPSAETIVENLEKTDEETEEEHLRDTTTPVRPQHQLRSQSISFENTSTPDFKGLLGLKAGRAGRGAGVLMSARVLNAVWTENVEFQTDRSLFDAIHFRFLWQLHQLPSVVSLLDQSDMQALGDEALQHQLDATTILATFSLAMLRFVVEVVARARAQGCYFQFVEQLEEMIIRDKSRVCAEAVLQELSVGGHAPATAGGGNAVKTSGKLSRDGALESGRSIDYSRDSESYAGGAMSILRRSQLEQLAVQRACHPWLIQMFMQCPHKETIKTFMRLLLTCIKTLRPVHCTRYLVFSQALEDAPRLTAAATSDGAPPDPSTANEMDGRADEGNGGTLLLPASETDRKRGEAKYYESCVTRLMNKLLLLAEKIQPEDLVGQEGYKMVMMSLSQVASLGFEEKVMLLSIGAVCRLVCSMLCINPSVTRVPTDDLQHCIDLLAILVRTAVIPSSESSTPSSALLVAASSSKDSGEQLSSNATSSEVPLDLTASPFMTQEALYRADNDFSSLPILSSEDLQAYLNRIYLEDAINIGPVQTCAALQHVCWSRGGRESSKLLEFVSDKVIECVMLSNGPSLAYRSYFRAVSELILGPAIDLTAACQSVLPALIQKADTLAVRQSLNDAEFVYAVLKLLHRIGTSSAKGQQCILKLKPSWRSINAHFQHHKRFHPKSEQASTQTATTGSHQGASSNADSVKKQQEASAFMSTTTFMN